MDTEPAGPPAAAAVEPLMRLLPILLLSMALTACASGPRSPTPGAVAPTDPPALCQPSVAAPSRAEPLPPETGMTGEILFDMAVAIVGEEQAKAWWKWFTVEYPEWAREGWTRIDRARGLPPCAR